MRSHLIALVSLVALGTLPAPAPADEPMFPAPAGWSSTATSVAAADPAHALMQWHLAGDDSSSVTFLRTSTSYDDSLAAIHTNFATNKIKPSIDKDLPCRGKTGHVIEFATGPDGHRVLINRMLVPMPDGVAAITYARSNDSTFDSAVLAAETTYCAST